MSYRWLVTVSAAALAFAAGCKMQSEPSGTTRTTSATSPTSTATSISTVEPIASADKEFMTRAAQDSMLEVTLGADAARLGSSPAVKELGDRLVRDHSKSDAELQELATKKGIVLSTELDEQHKKEIQRLEKLNGKAFDAEFAKFMISDHETDVKEFQKEATDAKDPDLRSWAARSVPILEQQLAMASSMKSKAKP